MVRQRTVLALIDINAGRLPFSCIRRSMASVTVARYHDHGTMFADWIGPRLSLTPVSGQGIS